MKKKTKPEYIIQIVGPIGKGKKPPNPRYLQVLHSEIGTHGDIVSTTKQDRARRFASPEEAMEYWNRPFTPAGMRKNYEITVEVLN